MSKVKQKEYQYLRDKYIENSYFALFYFAIYVSYLVVKTIQNPIDFPISFSLLFTFLSLQLSFAMFRLKQYYFMYPIVEILFVVIVVFTYFYSSVGKLNPLYFDKIKIVFTFIGALFIAVRGFETIEKKITPQMHEKKIVQYWQFLTSENIDKLYRVKDIVAIISTIITIILYILFYKSNN